MTVDNINAAIFVIIGRFYTDSPYSEPIWSVAYYTSLEDASKYLDILTTHADRVNGYPSDFRYGLPDEDEIFRLDGKLIRLYYLYIESHRLVYNIWRLTTDPADPTRNSSLTDDHED